MTEKEFDKYWATFTNADKWTALERLINKHKGFSINTSNGNGYMVYNKDDLNALVECELFEEFIDKQ